MAQITDPGLLDQLGSAPSSPSGGMVKDPALLEQLNGPTPSTGEQILTEQKKAAQRGPIGGLDQLFALGQGPAGLAEMGLYQPAAAIANYLKPDLKLPSHLLPSISENIIDKVAPGYTQSIAPDPNAPASARYLGAATEALTNPMSWVGPGGLLTKTGLAVGTGLTGQAAEDVGGEPGRIAGSMLLPLGVGARGLYHQRTASRAAAAAGAADELPVVPKFTTPRTHPTTGNTIAPDLLPPSVGHELPANAPAGAGTVSPLADVSPEAVRMVHKSLVEEGFTPHTLDATLEGMSPHQFALEVGNTPYRYARGIAGSAGQGASDIRGAFTTRATEAPDRLRAQFDQAFGENQDLAQMRRIIDIDRDRAANPLYQTFRSLEVPPTQALNDLIPRLEAAGAFNNARQLARVQGIPWRDVFTPESGHAVEYPTAETWDLVKRGIDTLIEGSQNNDGSPSNWTRVYTQLKNDLITAMNNHPDPHIGEVWRQARDAFAGPQAIKKAMDFGRRVLTGNVDADELPFLTAGYSEGEMAAMRYGMRNALENTVGSPGRQELRVINQILAPNNVRKLQWALPEGRADELVNGIRHEFEMHHSPRNIVQNSITAPMQQDIALWQAQPSRLGQAASFIRHPIREATAHGIEYGANRLAAGAEARAAAIRNDAARIYTMQGPERDATLRWILEHGENYRGPPRGQPTPPQPPPAPPEGGTPVRRNVIQRGRSGRPIRTEPLPIGTEEQILERGAERAQTPAPPEERTNEPYREPMARREVPGEGEPPERQSAGVSKLKGRSLEDLEQTIPPEIRRAGAYEPGRGTVPVEGGQWSDKDLTRPGPGLRGVAQSDINRMFQESLASPIFHAAPEQREAMRARVQKFMDEHPNFSPNTAAFWDKSMRLPDRARYWYEVSSEAFRNAFRGSKKQLQQFFDLVSATSPQADPTQNLRRAIGSLAEERQGVPIKTDLTDPNAVRTALSEEGLTGIKVGSFANTFSHILGLEDRPPLSVNDRQVASTFGIHGDDLMKEPWLHDVLGNFYIKMRDAVNQHPDIKSGKADPYEAWQLQALGWVAERGLKNEAKGKVENYDDYALVMGRLKDELQKAGVDTSDGILSDKVLRDPRTPNILSGTREQYLAPRTATLEAATTQTPHGKAAAELAARMSEAGDKFAKPLREYEAIQRRAMTAISTRLKGEPSTIEKLFSAVAGRKISVTRIDTNGYGTFEGQVSPNMRIPLQGRTSGGEFWKLDDPKNESARRAVLAVFGREFNQAASAASKFGIAEKGDPDAKTFSIFVRGYQKGVDVNAIHNLEKDLGYPLNVHQTANGTVIDINVGGFDKMPVYEDVIRAAEKHFPDGNGKIFNRTYDSDYLDASEYDKAIADHWKGQGNAVRAGKREGLGGAGPAPGDRDSFRDAQAGIREAAKQRDRDFKAWVGRHRDRVGGAGEVEPPSGGGGNAAPAKGEVLYHGTSKDTPFKGLRDAGNGTWFSTDPAEASKYAVENESMGAKLNPQTNRYEKVNTASRVIPMTHRFEKTFEMTGLPAELRNAENYRKAQREYFAKLRAEGYDSVRFREPGSKHSIVVSLDNSKLQPAYGGPAKGARYARGGSVNPVAHALHLARSRTRDIAQKLN